MHSKTIALALSLSALAAHGFTWGAKTTITGIYVYAGGTAYITTANNQNPDNCPKGAIYLAIDSTTPNFKALYATAMAAYLSGQTVSINYDGCLNGYALVNSVAMPSVW